MYVGLQPGRLDNAAETLGFPSQPHGWFGFSHLHLLTAQWLS